MRNYKIYFSIGLALFSVIFSSILAFCTNVNTARNGFSVIYCAPTEIVVHLDANGGIFASNSSTTIDHTLTYGGIYNFETPNKTLTTYTRTFPNGTTRTYTYFDSYGFYVEGSYTGYTFDGWYTEATGGTKITSSAQFPFADEITLYAHWTGSITPPTITGLQHLAMGNFPQTYVGNTLNTTLENLYSSGSLSLVATGKNYTTSDVVNPGTITSSTYFSISYATLPEYIYNGNKYARLASAVRPSTLAFADGTNIVNGTTYWFKVEPIPVMVMATTSDTNGVYKTVMCDMALGSHRFSEGHDSTYWRDSQLRIFLNGGRIQSRTLSGFYIDSGLNNMSGIVKQTTITGNSYTTSDYVWVPSQPEMVDASNGFTATQTYDSARLREATDLARATNTSNATRSDQPNIGPTSTYWTRTVGYYNYNISTAGWAGGYSRPYNTYGYVPCWCIDV